MLFAALSVFGVVGKKSPRAHHTDEDDGIWFVHATDPHIFVKPEDYRTEQQIHNRNALSDMLGCIGSLPDWEKPKFLVLTGDLGIDPCDIRDSSQVPPPAPTTTQASSETGSEDKPKVQDTRSADDCVDASLKSDERKTQIQETADRLGKSPIPKIYLVAGNNDIAKESAGNKAIEYFNKFIEDVRNKLTGKDVQLYNLTSCYASGQSSEPCYADIPETNYRLIGFPSYSFKGARDEAKRDHASEQANQLKIFQGLLDQSKEKRVLLISHTPAMDDPYSLGVERYRNPKSTAVAAPTPGPAATPEGSSGASTQEKKEQKGTEKEGKKAETKTATTETESKTSSVSTWKVEDKVGEAWMNAVASNSVLAVFAGHLHDSHKEVYRPPYEWSSASKYKATFSKLFLAPPLAIKKQDNSPIQARGFALVHLRDDRVESRLFWYDSETRKFTPDPKHKHHWKRGGFWNCLCEGSCATIRWLWDLEKTDSPLIRLAVLLIAFVTAFLTVVAIWQIPPANDPFADEKRTAQNAPKPAQATSNTASDSLPYTNRFGKTVIAGLGGLVAAEITKALGNEKPSADTRWYYIIWFVLFFFLWLVSLNSVRAFVEAVRARVAVVYYPLAPVGPVRRTARHWLVSLRVPLLTFFDTFINLIQGKNQTITRVFAERIVDQQRIVKAVADKIRANVSEIVERRVIEKRQKPGTEPTPDPSWATKNLVRVNISVLSADQSRVFYISRADGSSFSAFPKKSVAWISVFTGDILWFKSTYRDPDEVFRKIVLFDNVIPGEKGAILLHEYYQPREREDYHAFVIFPVPYPRRGFGGDYVKGAIQISFRDDADFDLIWKGEATGEKGKPPNYLKSERMLEDWCDDQVRGVLLNAIAALGELLRGFNEEIYQNYIEGRPAS